MVEDRKHDAYDNKTILIEISIDYSNVKQNFIDFASFLDNKKII